MTPQSNVMLFCSGYCQFAASMHVCELCACALWCKCGRERERDGEAERETEICLVRETSCYSVEMTHSSVR